jgi:hypothetical protein
VGWCSDTASTGSAEKYPKDGGCQSGCGLRGREY